VPHGGVVFLCDPRTEEECLQRGLFGLPATQTAIVRSIVPESTVLFLFNVRTRTFLGVFRATGWPQQNLEPLAWGEDAGGGSRFPLQVRVRLDAPAVLCLGEELARPGLDYHGTHNRFDLQMGEAAAASLVQLFSQYGDPRASPIRVGMGPPTTPSAAAPRPRPVDALGASSGVAAAEAGSAGSLMRGGSAGSLQGCLPSRAAWAGSAERTSGERASGDRSRRNGLVFICDPTTEEECLSRRLLGLPKSQSSLLSKLADTSLLFLFNVRTRKMLGVFAPDGAAGLELEPSAFGGDSRFPVQVRFVPLHPTSMRPSSAVLAIPEKAVADVLRYRNASTRFDLLLRGRAVDRIVAAFCEMGVPVPLPPPLPPPAPTTPQRPASSQQAPSLPSEVEVAPSAPPPSGQLLPAEGGAAFGTSAARSAAGVHVADVAQRPTANAGCCSVDAAALSHAPPALPPMPGYGDTTAVEIEAEAAARAASPLETVLGTLSLGGGAASLEPPQP